MQVAEKALARIPVKIGKAGEEQEVYLYRGEVANYAIRMQESRLDYSPKSLRLTM
jgi:hypothetical protein